jgi:rhamnogalacturonan endolyase
MSNRHYRLSAAHQNIGYNQPTQIDYYIGSDLK